MILNDLYNYYDKKLRDKYPLGSRLCDVDIVIVIDNEGNFVNIETGYKDKLVSFAPKRTSAPLAYVLCDKPQYVLGIGDDKNKYLKCFIEKTNNAYKETGDEDVKSVCLFYDKNEFKKAVDAVLLETEGKIDAGAMVSFRLVDSNELVASKESLFEFALKDMTVSDKTEICCITGKQCNPLKNSTLNDFGRYSFVTFQKDSGYDNYEINNQCLNSPMSLEGDFGYSTAFNHLCRRENNRFCVGGRDNRIDYVFFTNCSNEGEEEVGTLIQSLFHKAKKGDAIEEIKEAKKSIFSGKPVNAKSDDVVCIMGFIIDTERIKVVSYTKCTVKELVENIVKHLSYYIHNENRPDFGFGVYDIVSTIFRVDGEKTDKDRVRDYIDSHRHVVASLVKSIFNGTRYDQSFAMGYIRRINIGKVKNNETHDAMFRAILNRNHKIDIDMLKPNNIEDNNSVAYLLGRYIAHSAKIYMETLPQDGGKKDYVDFPIIRDNKSKLSDRPSRVFKRLVELTEYYASKSHGRGNWYLRESNRIKALIDDNGGIPNKLNDRQQCEFELGFSTQWQKFFEKREKNEETE